MTIPIGSNFPNELDTNDNLFEVHDSVRMKLAEDYNPGDKSILVDSDALAASRLPETGLITLTEQCSDIDKRAISFYYSSWDPSTRTISGLELLPEFEDVKKPKKITTVTVNVMDLHHNNIKDALIKIQEFCGVKGTEDKEPFGSTLEGRINFLRKLVMQPKAWFTSDKKTGNVPLEVEFKNMSFRLGTDGTEDEVKITWDFGDNTTASEISVIEATDSVDAIDVLVRDIDGGTIKKTYHKPGPYTVKIIVENKFGKDECVFEDYITARSKAPNEAVISFVSDLSTQIQTPGVPPLGPFDTPPKIRSPINTLIEITVNEGENFSTPGYSYGGEPVDEEGNPIDPIVDWTWVLGDDLTHPSSRTTKASYSIGGYYDLKLRVDTQYGAYRITNYEAAIDIVEKTNMWLWTFTNNTNFAKAYEYGLISETFKVVNSPAITVMRNDSFLSSNNASSLTRMKAEFRKNTGFSPRSNISSGVGGTALLYYASGRNEDDPVASEEIKCVEFDGFSGTYINRNSISRSWNWANLNSPSTSYFVFGSVNGYPPSTSPTNIIKQALNLSDFTIGSSVFDTSNFLNGAQELTENVSDFNNAGESIYGNFSVYRTTWKDSTGYILRNDGVGPFFRIKSFYKTEGVISNQFINIRKMQDIQGPTKLEGEMTNLSTGIYFLNNSGSVSKFMPEASVWTTGGPGYNSLLYRNLQDTSVSDFDNQNHTLLLSTDSDKRAYLSFDYSPNAFVKFNETDLTFSTLGSRPSGEQWIAGIF